MVEILVLWAFALAASMLLGEVVCRFAGLRPWSWLSGAAGVCVLLVVGDAGSRLPGRAATAFVVIAVLSLSAACWLGWREQRNLARLVRGALEPLLLAGAVLAATMIPFVANERIGQLGPSFNNDSRYHLWATEYLLAGQPVPDYVLGHGYPLGPHGLVAALASGLGTGVEAGLVALVMAIPVLMAFAARAALSDLPRLAALLVAGLTAMTYLLAAWYTQSAFKETLQALFVLALAVAVRDLVAARRLGPRAAPLLALLAAGSLVTYSYPGLAWIVGTLALAAAGLLVVHRRSLTRDVVRGALRRALPTIGVLAAVMIVALAPQAGRLVDFFTQLSLSPSGSGIIVDANIGNLVSALSPREALGVWFSEDYRFAPDDGRLTDALSVLAIGVALFGAIWWLRRREIVIVAAALASLALYVFLQQGESAYLAAKALAILSPFAVLLGAGALLARAPGLDVRWRALRLGVAALFVCAVAWSSFLALRNGSVNPGAHERELVSLRPLLAGSEVLFLGSDDYIGWRLFGSGRVFNPPIEESQVPLRKQLVKGELLDFDAIPADRLDRYPFVVTTRSAYASVPPRNFERVRSTRSFEVWKRRGPTPPDELLGEGIAPGAILDCAGDRSDRRLSRGPGRALVRPAPVVVQAPAGMGAGAALPATLRLPSAGRWEISLQYASPQVLTVSTSTGQGWRMAPNLDRLGPFWRAGELRVKAPTTLNLTIGLVRVAPPILTADSQFAPLGKIAAVRTDRPARWVALREACGRYVDSITR